MATALHIIERAFSKAEIRASETPLEASEVQDALDLLNDMLSEWDNTGLLKGAEPVDSIDSVVDVPRYSEGAIKANLAIRLAGEYGKEVTQSMAFNATDSVANLVKASVNFADVSFPATLPVGSGNQTEGYYDQRRFYPEQYKPKF